MWMSPLLRSATTTLPSHIPIARDTTRGSHYDNTGPLETTKIQARQTAGGRGTTKIRATSESTQIISKYVQCGVHRIIVDNIRRQS